jgi:hypothetical protein
MKNIRLSLIGPGDIDFHFFKLLGLKEREFQSELEKIAQSLVDSGVELELLPDRGISIELAKLYKQKGGKKVIGAVPKSDKTFGIEHLKEYVETKVDGKPLFDEIINSGDWFKHDLIKGLLGNAILYLGASPGTDGERHYAIYLYKLISRFKEGVEISEKRIHTEIRAGKNFSIFVYTPFLINKKLPPEDEAYAKKFGINLVYINNPEELKKELLNL